MKQQIDNLVELAKAYVEYAKYAELNDGWVLLRGLCLDPKCIRIYSMHDDSWSVNFLGVEISLYSEKIEFPYNYSAIDLYVIYEDAKQFLETLKNELEEKRKTAKIEELENELKKLKEQ